MTYTLEELRDKIRWEGGIFDAFLNYGISVSDLDTESIPQVTIDLINRYIEKGRELSLIEYELEDLLELEE